MVKATFLKNDTIRVLIANDTPSTRQGLKALLTMMPRVEVIGQAANGQEAVQFVDMFQPDVVLMDIQMPVMDAGGYTANQKALASSESHRSDDVFLIPYRGSRCGGG